MLVNRLVLLRIILVLVVLVFTGRLTYLQLYQGSKWRKASENNHLRWVRIPAPRGRVLDCQGRPLAASVQALSLWLVTNEVPRDRWTHLYTTLFSLGVYQNIEQAQKYLSDCQSNPSYIPVRLLSGLSIHDPRIARITEELPFLPGVYLKAEPERLYPYGSLAAHVIGYLGEASPDELKQYRQQGYRMGDRMGKTGVERATEALLRGEDGGEEVEVDTIGRHLEMDTFGRKQNDASRLVAPQAGTDVTLTLDLDIQQSAEAALVGHRGAAIALDPSTGDILALANSPTFDLNTLLPMGNEFNRAVRGQYPPGSVFKIVTAAAALEAGVITPNTTFVCTGEYHGIHCWKHSGHGAVSLINALAQSCNVYFMHLAELVGPVKLAAMARRFGFGQEIDIGGVLRSSRGYIPDTSKSTSTRDWPLGETLQMGIGQTTIQVTPLQAACLTAAIANGGSLVHPRILKARGDIEQPVRPATPLGLKGATLRWIEFGLREVVDIGTARLLDERLKIAGKTGTAQNAQADHAWFIGYAPYDHPTIAVAVIIENGGHGGVVAAPIAQRIIRTALHMDERDGEGVGR